MKFNASQAEADRRASLQRRAATRNQILSDQRNDAKRDAKALAAERRWFEKYGQVK